MCGALLRPDSRHPHGSPPNRMSDWTITEHYRNTFSPSAWAAFESEPTRKYVASNPEIVLASVAAYLVLVFVGQSVMKSFEPFSAKLLFRVWNFALASFSIVGAYMVVPDFLRAVLNTPHSEVLCGKPQLYEGRVGFWMCAFLLSKLPELIDTFWLVIQKKPVIFLHWYHHFTVLLYCWHSWPTQIPAGMWFCAMNYSVHAVMYSYYFLMTFPSMRFLSRWAHFITLAQIAQMVVGLSISLSGIYTVYVAGRKDCRWDRANMIGCAVMYFTYFLLFAQLFLQKRGGKGKNKSG